MFLEHFSVKLQLEENERKIVFENPHNRYSEKDNRLKVEVMSDMKQVTTLRKVDNELCNSLF